MSEDVATANKSLAEVLGGHENIRELVRLLQCTVCSRLFRNPVTLPCGNSLCRQCLPQSYERENISYPDLPGRRHGFLCPFSDCVQEHALGDCNIDVTLTKIMEAIATVILQCRARTEGTEVRVETVELVTEDEGFDMVPEQNELPQLPGGTFMATYALAVGGHLRYETDLRYLHPSEDDVKVEAIDTVSVHESLEAAKREVECQVCYSLMLNPVTTSCGHTLCRVCLTRVLDHTLHCPVCRSGLAVAPSLSNQLNNKTLTTLLARSWPDLIAARAEAVAAEEQDVNGQTFPLFVCTLAFPNHTTFLRIFEPRYRLMLRRCLEGSRQFGLVMYNRYNEPQGDLGNVHFHHHGTMVRIVRSQSMPDGTSFVELQGTYRIRVTSHAIVDGYSVGSVDRIDDMDIADEERIEAEETSAPVAEGEDIAQQLNRMSTQDLLTVVKDFIIRARARNSGFLNRSIIDVHGEPPDDAAAFPWWFASVMPIQDSEKYKLLPTRSVRERLKIMAGWVRRIEVQRWSAVVFGTED